MFLGGPPFAALERVRFPLATGEICSCFTADQSGNVPAFRDLCRGARLNSLSSTHVEQPTRDRGPHRAVTVDEVLLHPAHLGDVVAGRHERLVGQHLADAGRMLHRNTPHHQDSAFSPQTESQPPGPTGRQTLARLSSPTPAAPSRRLISTCLQRGRWSLPALCGLPDTA